MFGCKVLGRGVQSLHRSQFRHSSRSALFVSGKVAAKQFAVFRPKLDPAWLEDNTEILENLEKMKECQENLNQRLITLGADERREYGASGLTNYNPPQKEKSLIQKANREGTDIPTSDDPMLGIPQEDSRAAVPQEAQDFCPVCHEVPAIQNDYEYARCSFCQCWLKS